MSNKKKSILLIILGIGSIVLNPPPVLPVFWVSGWNILKTIVLDFIGLTFVIYGYKLFQSTKDKQVSNQTIKAVSISIAAGIVLWLFVILLLFLILGISLKYSK